MFHTDRVKEKRECEFFYFILFFSSEIEAMQFIDDGVLGNVRDSLSGSLVRTSSG